MTRTPKLGAIGLLLLRAWMGLSLAIAHGFGKLEDPDRFIEGGSIHKFTELAWPSFAKDLPLPQILGWSAIGGEVLGALLVAAGFLTRLGALAVVLTMAGAAIVVHGAQEYGNQEKAIAYGAIALFFLFHGPGPLSVDGFLFGRKRKGTPPKSA